MNRGSLRRGCGRSILLLYADSASANSLDRPQFFLGTNSCFLASGLKGTATIIISMFNQKELFEP